MPVAMAMFAGPRTMPRILPDRIAAPRIATVIASRTPMMFMRLSDIGESLRPVSCDSICRITAAITARPDQCE